jgi:threonine dehydratase
MSNGADEDVSLQSITAARDRIAGVVSRTPLQPDSRLGAVTGGTVHLKLENEQVTGSFKIRGAANAVLSHLEHGVSGVATASTGNHARAVAYVAGRHGLPVRVFVSRDVSAPRIDRLRREAGEIDASARDQNEAIARAREFASAHGYAFIPPFDDPAVISGQGSIGLELVEDLPHLGAVVVPISGGGLAAGIAVAVKSLRPSVQVIGVCAEMAPAMKSSLDAGCPVSIPERATVAESLRGDLGVDNRFTFRLVQQHVDKVVLVTEEEIRAAQDYLLTEQRMAVEGAAAAAVAVIKRGEAALAGLPAAAIVTGAA